MTSDLLDVWIPARVWDACVRPGQELAPRDAVTLGFSGGCLVACRMRDRHLQLLADTPNPGVARVAVGVAMARFRVTGLFVNPPQWMSTLDEWHDQYAGRMKVQASRSRPLDWWINRPAPWGQALKRFREAVAGQGITTGDDRSADALRRHVLNAYAAPTWSSTQIRKASPDSPGRIDGAVAAVLAYQATVQYQPPRRLRWW